MIDPVPRTESPVRTASDRQFGLVFAAVFLLVALHPLLAGGKVRGWAALLSAGLAVAAFALPAMLAPANRLWTRLGDGLHRLVSPVALALLFFLVVTPTGLILRLLGKDPLRLKREPDAPSYWIRRTGEGAEPSSFRNPF